MNLYTRWLILASLVILFSTFSTNVYAQLPQVDIGIFKKDSVTVQVRVRPDAFFNGIFSDVVFTIRWDAGNGTVLGTNYMYPEILKSGLVTPTKAGGETTVGQFTHQKFQGSGSSTLLTLGESWLSGEEIILMELDVTSAVSLTPVDDLTFEITQNAANNPIAGWNGGFYAELNAVDRSGIVYAIIANTLATPGPGLVEGEEDLVFSIYPNPATTNTTLQLTAKNEENFRYEVIDTKGKMIVGGRFEEGASSVSIPVEKLPSGFYLVQIINDLGEISYKRLVKQ